MDVGNPPRSYRVDIGYLARSGRFYVMARSNVVNTPRAGVSDVLDENWAVPIVPVGINVVWDPLPSPRRCWELGRALGQAIRSYDEGIRVAVIGTGGLSHELEGEAFGTIHYEWDRKFLDLIQHDPEALSRYSMEEFRRLGGHHSVEIVQWIAMRAALPDEARAEFVYYYPKQVMGYAVAAFATADGG